MNSQKVDIPIYGGYDRVCSVESSSQVKTNYKYYIIRDQEYNSDLFTGLTYAPIFIDFEGTIQETDHMSYLVINNTNLLLASVKPILRYGRWTLGIRDPMTPCSMFAGRNFDDPTALKISYAGLESFFNSAIDAGATQMSEALAKLKGYEVSEQEYNDYVKELKVKFDNLKSNESGN